MCALLRSQKFTFVRHFLLDFFTYTRLITQVWNQISLTKLAFSNFLTSFITARLLLMSRTLNFQTVIFMIRWTFISWDMMYVLICTCNWAMREDIFKLFEEWCHWGVLFGGECSFNPDLPIYSINLFLDQFFNHKWSTFFLLQVDFSLYGESFPLILLPQIVDVTSSWSGLVASDLSNFVRSREFHLLMHSRGDYILGDLASTTMIRCQFLSFFTLRPKTLGG